MHIDHSLQHFLKHSRFGRILHLSLLLAAMALQPMSAAWAAEGLTTSQTWHVLNETGIDLLGVQRLRITGPDAGAFAIEGYTGSPSGMTPSQDVFTPSLVQKTPSTPLGVNLRFTPQHSGSHQASLEVTHDGSNASPVTYPLTGAGAWDVSAQVSTNTIDFGEQAMGMPAMTQDAFVRAVGAHGWLKVTGVKLEGSSDFTLAQVGLATKGSSTWGVGANLDVLPAGATESTKTFTAADVSVGGLTDGAMRVRYTPTLRGPQTAKLVVYHDGPGGQSEVAVVANGSRGTVIEVTQGNPYDVVEPVADFARVGFGAATLIKSVYLKAGGVVGQVTYSGFKVEGSSDIVVTSVGLYGDLFFKPSSSIRKCGLNADPVISYMGLPEGGGREADFSLKGDSVSTVRCDTRTGSYVTNRPHLQINLAYLPRTLGAQSAKITVYHDGNDQGFTEFEISGDTFWDTSVELRGNSPFSRDAAAEVADFGRIGLDSAAQSKRVYLRASGTYGAVTYKGFKVEGSADFTVTQAGLIYNSGSGAACTTDPSRDKPFYSSPSFTYGEGAREEGLSITGISVTSTLCVTPGKDFGLTVQYAPHTLGKQTATITIYHDGNDEGFTTFDISGEAFWDTAVELRGNSPFSRDAAAEVASFGRIGLDSAARTKDVYLKASGTFGAVTYKGFEVEGSADFTVTQAGLIYNSGSGAACTTDPSRDKRAYSQPTTYEGEAQRGEFLITGASVSSTYCPAPGKDFGLIVQYTPSTLGKQTATITIYHDGNDEGFTTFDISGEAY